MLKHKLEFYRLWNEMGEIPRTERAKILDEWANLQAENEAMAAEIRALKDELAKIVAASGEASSGSWVNPNPGAATEDEA